MKRKNKSSKRSPKLKKVKKVKESKESKESEESEESKESEKSKESKESKVFLTVSDFDDTCDRCNGTGIWISPSVDGIECDRCNGTGHTGKDKTPIAFSGGAFEFPKKNKDYEDYKQMWKHWWKPLLKVKEDPSESVMRELADYAFILYQVSEVYSEITRHKLNKPNYPARVVLREYEQDLSDNYLCREDIEEIVNDDNLTPEQKVQEILKYLY
jgi:hypothetical protein